jgi:ATP-dependent DNA helicase RecG
MIKIFDDHIRFINPGSLMGGLVPEDLLKGDYIAVHRNKLLAEAFYLRGDIEKFGTAFYRIQSELQHSPELLFMLESHNGFTRSGLDVTAQDAAQDTAQDTAQVKDLIFNLEGDMTRDEIQEKLKLVHRENFRKFYLSPALASGLIEMTIPDKPNSKYQKYRLTKKGRKVKEGIVNSE